MRFCLLLSIILISSSIRCFGQQLDPAAPTTAIDDKKIFTAVEQIPQFPGGEKAFAKFLSNHIKYPAEAKKLSIQGRVFARFVVETDGSLTDIQIMREPGGGLGNEAIRVLNLSPKWAPGIQNGKPVRVQFTVPINFSLDVSPAEIFAMPIDTSGKIYNAVQIQPRFSGGTGAYDKFLKDNIQYPALAKSNNVSGRVFAQFIIECDGSMTDIKILRDPGSGLGEEAVRVLKLSPKWIPGAQNNKRVRVQFTVPVNFTP